MRAGIVGVLVAVIALNVLLRMVPLPDVDPPAGVEVIRTILRVKNWVLAGVVAAIVAGVVLEELAKRRSS